MVDRPRVQRRRVATRQRIVEVAVELFESQGFDATTVDQITEAADIGKGTFFTHFPTKEGVFSFLSEHVLEMMLGADDPSLPADEQVRASFAAAAEWFGDNEVIARMMVLARLRSVGKVAASAERGRLFEFFAECAQRGVVSGQWRDVPVQQITHGLAACYFSSVALWALEPESPGLGEVFDAQLDLLLTGIRR